MNGADLLCETLLVNGIDTCFANPGTSEMHFVAALDRQPSMRCVLGMSEGVVTGAADGYARMADKPAATLLHLGPGLANGIANLHNARRAGSPVVNIVGDHATYHLPLDAPLTSDVAALARPMSHWLGRAETADSVGLRSTEAIVASRQFSGQIATLILHADAAWSDTTAEVGEPASHWMPTSPDADRIRAAADVLRTRRNVTILVSGHALREPQLNQLSRIATQTGARLMAQQSNARMQRGRGRADIERVPYPIDQALVAFADTECVILIGAPEPVAFFAYPGKPGRILPETCQVMKLGQPDHDIVAMIDALAQETGADSTCTPEGTSHARPDLPTGPLTPDGIAIAVAQSLPENAVICDESVSSGRNFFAHTHGAAPHDFLQLTGGAIGIGMPLAVGAAIACPDRKVLSLQADGSGMYTVQALWTQARERLDIVTVIFANQRYQILHGELQNVGAAAPGENARRMLDLDDPALDWVSIAKGMGVAAARAETPAQFSDLLSTAFRNKDPFLIEAMI
ncbi:acetolactate synthase large subunit [Sedimentitalea sp.]|uniref:acetolactate synthase large subunit n=1 Tax=Sedimentitalea sp. TaxID=2048915 RepID=UPI00329A5C00